MPRLSGEGTPPLARQEPTTHLAGIQGLCSGRGLCQVWIMFSKTLPPNQMECAPRWPCGATDFQGQLFVVNSHPGILFQ